MSDSDQDPSIDEIKEQLEEVQEQSETKAEESGVKEDLAKMMESISALQAQLEAQKAYNLELAKLTQSKKRYYDQEDDEEEHERPKKAQKEPVDVQTQIKQALIEQKVKDFTAKYGDEIEQARKIDPLFFDQASKTASVDPEGTMVAVKARLKQIAQAKEAAKKRRPQPAPKSMVDTTSAGGARIREDGIRVNSKGAPIIDGLTKEEDVDRLIEESLYRIYKETSQY